MPTAERSRGEAARRQLERVLTSPGFARNDRLSRFLRFVIERHLDGRDSELKESVIAVEVFGRSPEYDPKQDSIVRTEAGRLRARLGEYYLAEGKDDPLVIELPKGGYVPVLRLVSAEVPSSVEVKASASQLRSRVRPLWVALGLGSIAIALAVHVWWRYYENAPIPVAVLPLKNLSEDASNDYFADGLTGEIIRNLSLMEGLVVRSQTSSFAFKGKPQNVRDAGRQLTADYILEGTVLRAGQQLRITAQLVRVRDDFPMWSGRYDRELTDVFAIQDEISRGIVNSLRLKLGRGQRRYETSTEAYDLYLRARAVGEGHGVPGRQQSIPFFETALAKDPSFAPAYAGLAMAHLVLSGNSDYDIPSELEKSRAAAEKAIQLDPLSAESYDALGAAQARDGQWEQSEKSFRHAMEIQPGRPESHGNFAIYCLLPLGRIEEAIRELRIAEKSEPLFMFFLGDALADAGRHEEAVNVCGKLPPEDPNRVLCIPGARVRQGRANEVIQLYARHPDNPPVINAALVCAYARTGRREEAEKMAASLPGDRIYAFACLGDKDRVFESLERAAPVGPIRMGWFLLRVDREKPGLLRGDPRLKALRKKVGLPE